MEPPAGKTHRLIYALSVEIEPPTGSASASIVIWLGRDGQPLNGNGNGLPRPPKERAIDLRVGDQVRFDSLWHEVRGVSAYRQHWLTDEQAERCRGDGDRGYLYRVAGPLA
jgi:hypothetical protein